MPQQNARDLVLDQHERIERRRETARQVMTTAQWRERNARDYLDRKAHSAHATKFTRLLLALDAALFGIAVVVLLIIGLAF